ncbi:MAG: RNA polymerase sigma-70 factor [Actinomycetota bacterium]
MTPTEPSGAGDPAGGTAGGSEEAALGDNAAAVEFEEHRHHLFGVAYRMLGSVAEAEDAVQETWLRWAAADRAGITSPRGWLTTVISRLSVDRLRSAQHRREAYVGPWLPEPIVRSEVGPAGPAPDPAEHAELADSLSIAFLTMLERLDPVERAAFLLREVFGHGYDEVAPMVDRSEVACRQIVHRAKERLGPDRPVRFDPGPQEERRLVDSFLTAAMTGDVDGLREVLAEDVIAWNDGGPERRAARKPVIGVDRVTTFVINIAGRSERLGDAVSFHHARVNEAPGVVVEADGFVSLVLAFDIGPDGIRTFHTMLNPAKLAHVRLEPTESGPATP